jgi:predicted metalloprotease with PDZ domain
LDGLARGGWQLSYSEQPSAFYRALEARDHSVDLMASIGVSLDDGKGDGEAGVIGDVLWNGPAFNAGLAPGMRIVAVNDLEFSAERLRTAISDAKTTGKPIRLLGKNLDTYTTYSVDYRGGLRYPHLTRAGGSDRLGEIIARHK